MSSSLEGLRAWIHHRFHHNATLCKILMKLEDSDEVISTALLYASASQHGVMEVLKDIKSTDFATLDEHQYGAWEGRGIGEHGHYKVKVHFGMLHFKYRHFIEHAISKTVPPDIEADVSIEVQYRSAGEFVDLLRLRIKNITTEHMPPVIRAYALGHLCNGFQNEAFTDSMSVGISSARIHADKSQNMMVYDPSKFQMSLYETFNAQTPWRAQGTSHISRSRALQERFPGCSLEEIATERMPGLYSTDEERKLFIFESNVLGIDTNTMLAIVSCLGVSPVDRVNMIEINTHELDFLTHVGFRLRK